MGYPIYHSQYTAAQIEASIGKTPRIKAATRTWEVWDIATSAYVDTGVSIDTELFVDPTLSISGYAADAKVTGDEISGLKSTSNKFVYTPTIKTSDVLPGYINADTGYVISGNYVNTNFMEIPDSKYERSLTTNCYFGSVIGCCFYDSSKEYISGIKYGEWGRKTITVSVPNNAKYFRTTLGASSYTGPSDFGLSYTIYTPTLLDDIYSIYDAYSVINDELDTVDNHLSGIDTSVERLSEGENQIDTFELGDIYNGQVLTSNYRMYTFYDTTFGSITTLWNKYSVYVWKYSNDVWSGLGWKTSDFSVDVGKYAFVVGRADSTTTALTQDEQNEINNNTKYLSKSASVDKDLQLSIKKVNLANNFGRIMNRQGEGYGYPDNSIEGILSALNDGYTKIRVSVAATEDGVFYCTHNYELLHNSELGYVKINGTTYANDININETDSAFMESITYKGYAVPTLESVLDNLVRYGVEVTIELKGAFTSSQLTSLVNLVKFYNIPTIFSLDYQKVPDLIAIDNHLDIGIIFQYTDARANNFISLYANSCKSLRFDCYWDDTINASSVINVIHPNYKLKLGGSSVSWETILNAMRYCDVCETATKLSNH